MLILTELMATSQLPKLRYIVAMVTAVAFDTWFFAINYNFANRLVNVCWKFQDYSLDKTKVTVSQVVVFAENKFASDCFVMYTVF